MSDKILDKTFAPDAEKYAEALSSFIKCKTVSDENKTYAGEFIKLREEIARRYPLTLQSAEQPFDRAIFMRVKGAEGGKPLVLMSHSDVVPENGVWKKNAWSGEINDDVVHGRGAVDTKGSLVAIFEAVESLLAEGYRPKKDLIILSSFSEEIAGDDVPAIIEEMKRSGLTAPALVIDEGGGIIDPPVPGVKGKYGMIGMAERGSARLLLESKSDKNGSAAANMAAFIVKASKVAFGKRDFGTINTLMFDAMKPNMIPAMRFIFNHLGLFKKPLIKLLPKVNKTAATILGPTVVFGNPTDEECKNLPFEGYGAIARISTNSANRIDDVIQEFTDFAVKEGITVTLLKRREAPADATVDSAGYKFTSSLIADVFDDVTPAPYNILGGTDARHFIGYADNVIRFAPIYMNNQQFSSFHRVDENINVSSLVGAVKFYREAILRYDVETL